MFAIAEVLGDVDRAVLIAAAHVIAAHYPHAGTAVHLRLVVGGIVAALRRDALVGVGLLSAGVAVIHARCAGRIAVPVRDVLAGRVVPRRARRDRQVAGGQLEVQRLSVGVLCRRDAAQ